MNRSSFRCRFIAPANLVLLWVSAAIEQVAASLDSNFSLSKPMDHIVDQCAQYFQDGQDLCVTTKACCQTGVDEYGWIAAAVGWSLWFLTLILVCISKVAKLKPDEPRKYTAA
ncbi:transmembrane protein 213 [Amblyraja radiata]|uniref:transmembrane protein 213 n=1 Tax=Amblyraja radiata TaxID=386614 RepID=UPI001403863D|nr:transmembrane protein 213 [Amblyraja radiata]